MSEQPQLWAALRDRLEPSLALVRHARPDQLPDVWERADPWPWLVVGATPAVPEALAGLLSARPIPVLWLRRPAGQLPAAAVVHSTWAGLAARLDGLATASVFGLRFAPRRGVWSETRRIGGAPELEGLMAAHPLGLPAFEHLGRVRRTLSRHRLACRLTVAEQLVHLEAAERRAPLEPSVP